MVSAGDGPPAASLSMPSTGDQGDPTRGQNTVEGSATAGRPVSGGGQPLNITLGGVGVGDGCPTSATQPQEATDAEGDNDDEGDKGQASSSPHTKCDYCERDLTVSNSIRMQCIECRDWALCLDCFLAGVEVKGHKRTHAMYPRGNYNRVLFKDGWTVDEGLYMLEALEMYGIGSWEQISRHVSSRSIPEVEQHFRRYFGYTSKKQSGQGDGDGDGRVSTEAKAEGDTEMLGGEAGSAICRSPPESDDAIMARALAVMDLKPLGPGESNTVPDGLPLSVSVSEGASGSKAGAETGGVSAQPTADGGSLTAAPLSVSLWGQAAEAQREKDGETAKDSAKDSIAGDVDMLAQSAEEEEREREKAERARPQGSGKTTQTASEAAGQKDGDSEATKPASEDPKDSGASVSKAKPPSKPERTLLPGTVYVFMLHMAIGSGIGP
ncbi:transcriptional adaptor 2 [Kipferlia bialata]|uniref:Transcriptional adaptor 2 n=1 Tax=Kipferlia bialata TaxID=797122 RepID=A0A9K3GML1_9EUKA|nr:transcriptional adaptor 2 [Kipferlia bialata]|eukprot:g10125.t1